MKYLSILVLAFGLLATNVARAEVSVAVLDVQKLLTQSQAAESIQSQSEKLRDSFLEKLSKQEQDLREKEKKLVEDGKSLSKEEFLERKKEFEKEFIETQNMAKKRKAEIDQAYSKAMSKLMDSIYGIVQDVADEKGYSLVLSKQNVVLGEQELDITDNTMKILNDKVSDIKLDVKSN